MATKIRKDDKVIILAGKDKGKRGIVKSILFDRIIVTGINMIKKHQKAIPSSNITGGIIKKESSIHISNVAIFNEKTNKADRVGFKIENEKKMRFFKSTKEIIK